MLLAAVVTIAVFSFADQFHNHPADFNLHEDCPVIVLNLFAELAPLLFFFVIFLPDIPNPLFGNEERLHFRTAIIFKKLYSRRAPPFFFSIQY